VLHSTSKIQMKCERENKIEFYGIEQKGSSNFRTSTALSRNAAERGDRISWRDALLKGLTKLQGIEKSKQGLCGAKNNYWTRSTLTCIIKLSTSFLGGLVCVKYRPKSHDKQAKNISAYFLSTKKEFVDLPGFDPGTPRLLSGCDTNYTTGP
jgi:hypothetical protein